MKNFIEFESELPTVCGDPAKPRCHKGVCESNRPEQAMRCDFREGHGGCCQYSYLESQLYMKVDKANTSA